MVYQDLLRDYKDLSAAEDQTENQEQELKSIIDMLMIYWFPFKRKPTVILTTTVS